MANYTFQTWQRAGGLSITRGADGRPRAQATLEATSSDGTSIAQNVPFAFFGPGDVRGLAPGGVSTCYPRPGEPEAETTFCPYVEFAQADLPWRYSPGGPVPDGMRPWLVLIVVKPAEVALSADGTAWLSVEGQAANSLDGSASTAHVQLTAGAQAPVTRLLCTRSLDMSETYHALLVPAFDENGADRWNGTRRERLPVYHHWVFRTGPQGDFQSLADELHPADNLEGFGTVGVRVNGRTVQVRGALTGIGDTDSPPDADAAAELTLLLASTPEDADGTPDADAAGRPYLRPPVYGAAWRAHPLDLAPPAGWVEQLNKDPRHRAIAGLGLTSGVALQEEICAAAADRAGEAAAANQHIAALAAGLAAATSLWDRRRPPDTARALRVLGPSMARIAATEDDDTQRPLLELAAGNDRFLPRGLFSSAARRILRRGAARFRHTTPTALDDAPLLTAANTERPTVRRPADSGDPRYAEGVAHLDTLAPLLGPVREHPVHNGNDLVDVLRRVEISHEVARVTGPTIAAFPPPSRPDRRPTRLEPLAETLLQAFDPTLRPVAAARVLSTIRPADDPEPLAPREVCLPLDVALWSWLRDAGREWLLPGADTLTDGEVVALAVNPVFIDAFLVGANTQALSELRWRNLRLPTGCTPLRRFWDRYQPPDVVQNGTPTLEPTEDIEGIAAWFSPPGADPALDARRLPLGDDRHSKDGKPRNRLAVVFCTDLFRRYPGTLVYLAPRISDLVDAWSGAFLEEPIEPQFAARITPKLVLFSFPVAPTVLNSHFVVVEQAPQGFRFRRSSMDQVGGAVTGPADKVAAKGLDRPVRVLFAGPTLTGDMP